MNHGSERNRQAWEKLTPQQQEAAMRMKAKYATPEARAEEARVRELVEQEFPPLDSVAIEFLASLRLERERQGVSLGELSRRTGVDGSTLSKLETGKYRNPTIATLQGYLQALGKRLVLGIEDDR